MIALQKRGEDVVYLILESWNLDIVAYCRKLASICTDNVYHSRRPKHLHLIQTILVCDLDFLTEMRSHSA